MKSILELSRYALKEFKKRGADDVVINTSVSSNSQIKFVNNKIAKIELDSLSGISFFVVKDKKILSTSVKDVIAGIVDDVIEHSEISTSKKKIDNSINKTMKFIETIQPKKDYYGLAKGPFKYKNIEDTYDKKIEELSGKNKIDLVLKGIQAAQKEGAKRCSGIFETSTSKNMLLTSNNVETISNDSSVYFSVRSFLEAEASGHMTSTECTLRKLDVEHAGKFSGKIAAMAKNPVKGDSGKYDVIFAPLAFGVLLSNIGGSASMFDIEAGVSFFGDSMGKQVASPKVTIYDDGTLPGGLSSGECDAEGVPTQRTPIIENGIFKNYLYNTSMAAKYKTKTTGNAGLISPTAWNTILEGGKSTPEQLIKQIQNGLYITNVWYMRFQNYVTGDFSVIPRDGIFYIKNGKIKHPIKNIRIKENMINLLKNVKDLGNDSRQMCGWEIDGSVITPHLLVKDVTITKPTK
ncbi:MAG: TldD/PmbA family protein [Nanoarchaeota archaeon]